MDIIRKFIIILLYKSLIRGSGVWAKVSTKKWDEPARLIHAAVGGLCAHRGNDDNFPLSTCVNINYENCAEWNGTVVGGSVAIVRTLLGGFTSSLISCAIYAVPNASRTLS